MNIAIRYVSRSGNTKKLADAIARAVDVPALDLSSPLTEAVDLLFLGNSVYAGKPDAAVEPFLAQNAEKIGAIVNFGSSASLRSTHKKIEAIAAANGIAVREEEFFCPGSFLFMHKGRPNTQDEEAIGAFAKKVIG